MPAARHPGRQRFWPGLILLLNHKLKFSLSLVTLYFQSAACQRYDHEIMLQSMPSIFAGFHVGDQIIRKQGGVHFIINSLPSHRGIGHLPMRTIGRVYLQQAGRRSGDSGPVFLSRPVTPFLYVQHKAGRINRIGLPIPGVGPLAI